MKENREPCLCISHDFIQSGKKADISNSAEKKNMFFFPTLTIKSVREGNTTT